MMLQKSSQRRVRSAFTLLEILIVVAIIVVVAGVGGYYLFGALDRGKIDAAKSQMRIIETAIDAFRLNNGGPPTSLDILLQPDPANGDNPYLTEPKAIIDPWGNPYGFEYNDMRRVTIYFKSPNGRMISNRDGSNGNQNMGP